MDLTDRDRLALGIAGRSYRHQASRERAIRVELDLSWTNYCQLLNQVIDRPEALAYDPVLVNRLRRLRAERLRRRRLPAVVDQRVAR